MSLKARIEDGIVHSPYPGGSVPKILVCQAIKERLVQHGERTALICKENKVTSSEMLKMLHQYAAGFQSHGVKPGDKVLVHVDDSLESFIAMYGVVFAGGVVIPSELATEQDELLTKIKDGNASHVLTTPSDADLLKKLTEETHIRECFVVGDKPGFISVTKFKNVPEKSFTGPPVVDVEKELIALCFTSGTTGRPKAVEDTHYSCVAGLQLYRLNMMFDETETVGALFPVAQTVGFRMLMRVVCSGATCVIIPEGTSFDETVDVVWRHKVKQFVYTVYTKTKQKTEYCTNC
ncbi:3-hydroxybenzoate--CoA/4-hydroxybenzoate--CoA ligase-like [Ixodes scapularis]|uniref:3-hydroxybenzoate--CoA/4-hydroxybenzoate--CoA ligase-like n=1 Tax=Ixodes scapularis TaxID=6945 RepID=UPI001C3853E8|nr:3-hydroxybenzoate--CoA/4-hydroxybenzoate--CoA ligase-like [Ixodes scapularis]